ncbi:hypothetical protein PRZ48_008819 [Zasmidium cellare]|uniref:Uncharacterized protein n=1 Tax=Zasmidium cellare TaxID=395010 RepID=A0ABR0EGL9_ZASCE|nr:hypothetical protein PRZ48_008819 [Zasmidium cellare]
MSTTQHWPRTANFSTAAQAPASLPLSNRITSAAARFSTNLNLAAPGGSDKHALAHARTCRIKPSLRLTPFYLADADFINHPVYYCDCLASLSIAKCKAKHQPPTAHSKHNRFAYPLIPTASSSSHPGCKCYGAPSAFHTTATATADRWTSARQPTNGSTASAFKHAPAQAPVEPPRSAAQQPAEDAGQVPGDDDWMEEYDLTSEVEVKDTEIDNDALDSRPVITLSSEASEVGEYGLSERPWIDYPQEMRYRWT